MSFLVFENSWLEKKSFEKSRQIENGKKSKQTREQDNLHWFLPIHVYSNNVPKSPIREILELEPETAQFGKPEKLADGRRVRCTLEIIGKGVFKVSVHIGAK